MKIAIINHSRPDIAMLEKLITSHTGHEVVWTAGTASEALDKTMTSTPDLAVVSLGIAGNDIASLTDRLTTEFKVAVLVAFKSAHSDSAEIFNAMGAGALDSAQLPVSGTGRTILNYQEILEKFSTIAQYLGLDANGSKLGSKPFNIKNSKILAIGASTGGPAAIRTILQDISPDLDLSVVVIQHMDETFSDNLARWLDKTVPMPVNSAKNNDFLAPGKALVACTNDHLVCTSTKRLQYQAEPKDYPYRPSVDVFFHSLVKSGITPGIAVILTGMGRDGAAGLLALRQTGWYTIGQDKKTSTVYGMPKAANDLGACKMVLPVDRIASAIVSKIEKNIFIRN